MKTDMQSKVLWFSDSKGYGYIAPLVEHARSMGYVGQHQDIFVHYSAIKGEGFKTLKENETVIFDMIIGPKGPLATNVRRKEQ